MKLNRNSVFYRSSIYYLFACSVLLLLTTISVPYAFDTIRLTVNQPGSVNVINAQDGSEVRGITELHLGIWDYCAYTANDSTRICVHTGADYTVSVNNTQNTVTATIKNSWTRGLAIYPVATIITFAAFVFSFTSHRLTGLYLTILAWVWAMCAFAVDIAFIVLTKQQMNKITGVSTGTGTGFWLTFNCQILLPFAVIWTIVERQRERKHKLEAEGNGWNKLNDL